MSKLNDEYIEEAFAKVRASFEKRDNAFGLEMLDGYEAYWAETGHLSDGQLEWLERQLQGNWRQAPKGPSLRVVRGGAVIDLFSCYQIVMRSGLFCFLPLQFIPCVWRHS